MAVSSEGSSVLLQFLRHFKSHILLVNVSVFNIKLHALQELFYLEACHRRMELLETMLAWQDDTSILLWMCTDQKTNNMFNLQLYSNVDVITSLLACYVL